MNNETKEIEIFVKKTLENKNKKILLFLAKL